MPLLGVEKLPNKSIDIRNCNLKGIHTIGVDLAIVF